MKIQTVLLLSAASVLCTVQARAADKCPGLTTPEIADCQKQEVDKAQKQMARYIVAAEGRIRQSADPEHALADFHAAQQHWAQYQKAECNAAYEAWSDGTIRFSMALTCMLRLTHSRTMDIWQMWLTYPDSTPPTLPKPVFTNEGW
ncbi:lysozyme inhibitor LprI family protein [Acetobacter pasteurianus]|uniref:Lysozyme inhibitor LprI-like N-terminal domain-containing protein n=1 Tax=Acetobacter pasteurianus NBRC 3188 TaxID=1226663 RepID=A0A401WQW3_ACEPA|nr:lysozyme inhibitor LprI family protein [Acetobacter pasteurianus]GCD51708.1 hypothetical protein NBRC3188_0405 [Acetobacter pasteurianus NBRC 3188]